MRASTSSINPSTNTELRARHSLAMHFATFTDSDPKVRKESGPDGLWAGFRGGPDIVSGPPLNPAKHTMMVCFVFDWVLGNEGVQSGRMVKQGTWKPRRVMKEEPC